MAISSLVFNTPFCFFFIEIGLWGFSYFGCCRGDRAFCSVECRCRQIIMDEESVMKENCWVAAASSRGKGKNRKRGGGLFAC